MELKTRPNGAQDDRKDDQYKPNNTTTVNIKGQEGFQAFGEK